MKNTAVKWILGLCVITSPLSLANAAEYINGITWEEPSIIDPGSTNDSPPSDAVVLFGGSDLSHWKDAESWKVQDGEMIAGTKTITSKEEFGDCQVHVEWTAPSPPHGEGQGRGNSGIFLMGIYEIQVLDSYQSKTYCDGQAGAIYKQTPPAANAMRAPGEWNTYEIFWTAPRFNDDGTLRSPAFITAVHNGILILNHFELKGNTPYSQPPSYTAHSDKGPIKIQDHGNPVKFRNIWVREFKPASGEQTEPAYILEKGEKQPIEN